MAAASWRLLLFTGDLHVGLGSVRSLKLFYLMSWAWCNARSKEKYICTKFRNKLHTQSGGQPCQHTALPVVGQLFVSGQYWHLAIEPPSHKEPCQMKWQWVIITSNQLSQLTYLHDHSQQSWPLVCQVWSSGIACIWETDLSSTILKTILQVWQGNEDLFFQSLSAECRYLIFQAFCTKYIDMWFQ